MSYVIKDARPLARVAKMLLPTRSRAKHDVERMVKLEGAHAEIRSQDAVLTLPLEDGAVPSTTFVPLDVLDKAGRDMVGIKGGAVHIGRVSVPLPCPTATAEVWEGVNTIPPIMSQPLKAFTVPAAMLQAALEAAQVTVSAEETRYYLNGVHIGAEDGLPVLVATDGHRLVAATMDTAAGAALLDKYPDVIVPREVLPALNYMLKDGGEVSLYVDQGVDTGTLYGNFIGAGWSLSVRLINAQYPDWRRIMPLSSVGVWGVDTAELSSIVRDAKRFGPDKCKKLALYLRDSKAKAGDVSIDLGLVSTEGDVPDAIGINYDYLGDVVKVFGVEQVKIGLRTAEEPFDIVPAATPEWGDLRMVLMPLRV